ncbi:MULTISPECIES: hypothetical protein [Gordonia]|uniref:Uncharacterized protein n=2 Tax=Gordonia TaxID=2053 RepID=L7LJ04_9ACTN|nr:MULTISPECIES: hypothetical protein [Gordonia]MBY4569467.1 hypothetical protein [Gordonia sihwensis]WFN93982.1 hypothetical protein P5P27_05355 [Gordonia sihwensis]GAC61105.1 hypothetical protein GSI01S_14_01230 [Gordonia sihwensis NBRC 108236]
MSEGRATIGRMDESWSGDGADAHLVIPADCIAWCRNQPYAETVLEDVVEVDLDWWNERLAQCEIPAQVSGRDADGTQVWKGTAYLRRGDLEPGVHGMGLGDEPELDRLYMCAAWLAEHPLRGGVRRFVDVRSGRDAGTPFAAVERALVACRRAPALIDAAAYRDWSGWPVAPGVGHVLMSLYCWAIHSGAPDRPQLLDAASAGSLTWNGWLVASSVSHYSVRRYVRYNSLLHRWAAQAGVAPELVEMWLNRQWHSRLAEAAVRDGSAL